MRWTAVVGLGLLAALTGCNLVHYAGHNLVREPIDRTNEHKLSHRLRKDAQVAWEEVCRQYPARTLSRAFADGFQEGYADHLDNGGPPLPPAVPPPRYRSHPNSFTPEGHAAARDYLLGFQYGAEIASLSGRRDCLTVPVLLANEAPSEAALPVVKFPSPPEIPASPLPLPRTQPVPLPAPKPNPVPQLPNETPTPEPRPKSLPPLPPLPPVPPAPSSHRSGPPASLVIPAGGPEPVELKPVRVTLPPPPPVFKTPPLPFLPRRGETEPRSKSEPTEERR